jgi:hypothetical protein
VIAPVVARAIYFFFVRRFSFSPKKFLIVCTSPCEKKSVLIFMAGVDDGDQQEAHEREGADPRHRVLRRSLAAYDNGLLGGHAWLAIWLAQLPRVAPA